MTRKALAGLLLAGAVLLGAAGMLLWAKATHDAEERSQRDRAVAVVFENPQPTEVEPDRTLSTIVFGAAGVLLLSGVLVLAMSLPATADREHHPGG